MRRTVVFLIAVLLPAALSAEDSHPVPQAVAALAHLKPKPDAGPYSWTAGPYQYDASGNVIAIGSEAFVYDKLRRLKMATIRGPDSAAMQTQTFGYDDYGNLTSTSKLGQTVLLPAELATNRLSTLSYDASGNAIASGTESFDYDAAGMLSTIRLGSTQPRIVYAYTADDERLFSFDVSTGITHWTLRGLDNKVLRDIKQEGATWTVERDYIYRDGLLLAALKPAGAVEHFTLDHLGTPRLITDGAGDKIGIHAYWPFGEEWTPGNAQEGSPLKFTGHERDADPSGGSDPLDYMHARYYGAKEGRFFAVDPVLNAKKALPNPQGWNRYAYVGNNPLSGIDPDGRCDTCLDQELQDEQVAVANGEMSLAQYNARNNARGAGAGVGAAIVAAAFLGRPALVQTSMFVMRNPRLAVAALRVIAALGGVDSVEVPGPVNAAQGKAEFLLGEVASETSRSRGKVFAGVLGFTKETLVPALKNHLLGNLGKAGVDLTRSTVRIRVTAPITGPNGVTTTITTVWQITGGKISLVTGW